MTDTKEHIDDERPDGAPAPKPDPRTKPSPAHEPKREYTEPEPPTVDPLTISDGVKLTALGRRALLKRLGMTDTSEHIDRASQGRYSKVDQVLTPMTRHPRHADFPDREAAAMAGRCNAAQADEIAALRFLLTTVCHAVDEAPAGVIDEAVMMAQIYMGDRPVADMMEVDPRDDVDRTACDELHTSGVRCSRWLGHTGAHSGVDGCGTLGWGA